MARVKAQILPTMMNMSSWLMVSLQQWLIGWNRAADAAPCWLQAVFEVGLAAESDPGVHKNSLVRGFEESLQWWLATRPEVSLGHMSIPHHIQ